MRIKIKNTPKGKAPPWVLESWKGIVLESFGKEDLRDLDILINRDCLENLGGYKVDGRATFGALRLHNEKAYRWWVENCPEAAFATLVFQTSVCEELP